MTWHYVSEHHYGCPDCGRAETEAELRVTRTEIRTRSKGVIEVDSEEEKVVSETEYCAQCGRDFDDSDWSLGQCVSCEGQASDCVDLRHCDRCREREDDCECERSECCENFTDACECKESDVKEKDNTIEKAVQVIENISYAPLETRILAKVAAKAMFNTPTGGILADIVFPFGLKKHTAPTPDPVPDKNRIQTPAARWTLPDDDLPEE